MWKECRCWAEGGGEIVEQRRERQSAGSRCRNSKGRLSSCEDGSVVRAAVLAVPYPLDPEVWLVTLVS